MMQMASTGIKNPGKVPPFLKEALLPARYAPQKKEDGVITWNTNAGFKWGDGSSPPQKAAINYHMIQALRKDLRGNTYDRAVEIGCGYGRVTPWLSEFATEVIGVDPNEEVLDLTDQYYPHVTTHNSKAQNLPFPDNHADLLFTRSVLQHIPQDVVEPAVDEMIRIATDDADILICEATEGDHLECFVPRTEEEYNELFEPFSVVNSWERETPAKTRKHNRTRMLLRK